MEQPSARFEASDHREEMTPRHFRYKDTQMRFCSRQQDGQNYQYKERKCRENQSHCSSPASENASDYEDEDDEADCKFKLEDMRYADARMGICSICHHSVTGKNTLPDEFEKALLCSEGHLLCYHCVQQYAVKSETNCVLCATAEAQQSVANFSGADNTTQNDGQQQNKKSRLPQPFLRTPTVSCKRERVLVQQPMVDADFAENSLDEEWESEDSNNCNVNEKKNKQRSSCSIVQKETVDDLTRSQNSGLLECSRRPIQCPRQDCAVNVAFSALTNHFIFDHPEVPVLGVEPGEKSTFIVNFDGLVYDSSRCLALLLVSGKLSGTAAKQFNGNSIHPHYKSRLPLPILAARLHCNASNKDTTSEVNCDSGADVVIAWVAGLDIGNVTTGAIRCSIQAIDSIGSEAFRSLTYTGPINSLRTAQRPRDVFLIGDCVILHNGFINHITSGCKNLNVNVTIH